jgi:NAD(P)-dependent dehydrogenase (short-subunit alcohol dehydrogenase family)
MNEPESPRVVLVTGATGAIGKAIARRIANTPGYKVVLLARNEAKAAAAVEELRRDTGNPEIRYELADLSHHQDILALAKLWQGTLQVLVNNAAETPRSRELTREGIERQFATNVLGYFRTIQAFIPLLSASSPARVVNVASYWAGGLDLSDLEFKRRVYDNDSAYRQSKQANRMLTVAFAKRLKPRGIIVNACHPGDVRSKLASELGLGGHETPDQGAQTPAWLATDAIGGGLTGKYFEQRRQTRCRFSENQTAIEALFEACAAYG